MSEKNAGGPAFPTTLDNRMGNGKGMTLRQYAAIKLRVPDSGTDWLDEMILASLRDELAAKAMQGFSADVSGGRWADLVAKSAYHLADAMLKARES